VRLQLHALAYNLGNFLRTLATPEPIKDWSLTSLKEKLIKIGAKVVSHISPPARVELASAPKRPIPCGESLVFVIGYSLAGQTERDGVTDAPLQCPS
jgi:Transposase DDE domain group 1